jgi:DNA-binding MarR family transcriptional regulator
MAGQSAGGSMTRPSDITEAAYEWADIFVDEHRHIEDDRELVARAYMLATQTPIRAGGGLTHPQSKVLAFVAAFASDHGYSPTYAEIAEGIGLSAKTKGRIHAIVSQLEERGFVRRLRQHSRSITIVRRAA